MKKDKTKIILGKTPYVFKYMGPITMLILALLFFIQPELFVKLTAIIPLAVGVLFLLIPVNAVIYDTTNRSLIIPGENILKSYKKRFIPIKDVTSAIGTNSAYKRFKQGLYIITYDKIFFVGMVVQPEAVADTINLLSIEENYHNGEENYYRLYGARNSEQDIQIKSVNNDKQYIYDYTSYALGQKTLIKEKGFIKESENVYNDFVVLNDTYIAVTEYGKRQLLENFPQGLIFIPINLVWNNHPQPLKKYYILLCKNIVNIGCSNNFDLFIYQNNNRLFPGLCCSVKFKEWFENAHLSSMHFIESTSRAQLFVTFSYQDESISDFLKRWISLVAKNIQVNSNFNRFEIEIFNINSGTCFRLLGFKSNNKSPEDERYNFINGNSIFLEHTEDFAQLVDIFKDVINASNDLNQYAEMISYSYEE